MRGKFARAGRSGTYPVIAPGVDSTHEAELATLPADTRRFHVFDWGGFAGTNEFVVYDETDGIGLPAEQRREPIPQDQDVCDVPAKRIVGLYYFC